MRVSKLNPVLGRRRGGFTLLEMLLTLAMCVVLMSLIGGAMTFYIRDMSTAEDSFRESQIATAVLQMIEDDLRMTVTTRPVSTDGLAEVLSAAASPMSALTGMGDSGGAGDDPGATGDELPEDPGLTDETMEADSVDLTLAGTVLASPGVIGNADQLQIDVSRLPRLEETMIDPAMAASGGDLIDRPSDIKTVSYFVQAAGLGNGNDALEQLATSAGIPPVEAASEDESNSITGGLVRRVIDRAIHVQASSTGGIGRLSGAGEMLASEVTAIAFEYFDGVNWLPMINTDELGYLPPAVRVTLTMDTRTFTHVIYLPMSHPEDAEEMDTTTDTS